MKKINIAIDGPAGAGKSTVAKLLAEELGYIYIDTGAMYRALTWKALQDKVDVHNEAELLSLLNSITIRLERGEKEQRVFVGQEDVTGQIRTREVTKHVSIVASHSRVREIMVNIQRSMAEHKGVVMDGRDIGTHVLPQAEVKIYLSASIEERAKRRYLELTQMGRTETLAEIEEEIRKRDEMDMNRSSAPLQKAEDAHEIDSTGLTIEQVVNHILTIVRKIQSLLK